MKKIIDFIAEEFLLCIFAVLLLILALFTNSQIRQYPSFVDWKTISVLAGLLIITTGLKQSGYFNVFAKQMLFKIKTERKIAIFLIFLSAGLSCFITNDIALFIVVPLTLSLRRLTGNDISKLVIFEAIAVNAGSALIPIGNPQNLFLWHHWNISFFYFIAFLMPLVLCFLLILFLFVFLAFPDKQVTNNLSNNSRNEEIDKSLLRCSLIALIVYIVSLEMDFANLLLPLIFAFYLIFYRKVIAKTDWLLLLIFIFIFIDFRLIATFDCINNGIKQIDIHSRNNIFFLSAGISQLISNVPASIFISKFSNDWLAITYGVNTGGNGIVIASLANIIALRILKDKKAWLKFHKYSIPYFLITALSGYIILLFF